VTSTKQDKKLKKDNKKAHYFIERKMKKGNIFTNSRPVLSRYLPIGDSHTFWLIWWFLHLLLWWISFG